MCYVYLRTIKNGVLNLINGTEKRTRTSTGLPPLAPEASVSTNSTTSALAGKLLKIAVTVNSFSKNMQYFYRHALLRMQCGLTRIIALSDVR